MRRLILVSALVAVTLFLQGFPRPSSAQGDDPPPLKFTFLPLKKGEAALVEAPGGLRGLIGSGAPEETDEVLRFLKQRGIRKLDVLMVTTWSERHSGGTLSILQRFPVRQFLLNPVFIANKRNDAVIKWALARQELGKLIVTQPTPGERVTFFHSPPCQMRAVGPTGPMLAKFERDPRCSLTIEFIYDRISVLWLGDTAPKHQQALLKQADPPPDGQVLIVGRDGAADSLLPTLPRTVKTEVAVIPIARQSGRKPAPATLEALKKAHARIYQTGTPATLTLSTDGRKVTVTTR